MSVTKFKNDYARARDDVASAASGLQARKKEGVDLARTTLRSLLVSLQKDKKLDYDLRMIRRGKKWVFEVEYSSADLINRKDFNAARSDIKEIWKTAQLSETPPIKEEE